MRLSAQWLTDPDLVAVVDALEGAGARSWFVGGCVRDGLLGRPVGDIDIATDAPPKDVTRSVEASQLRAVPTGEDHGTITVVSGDTSVEVTTLRRDIATDGRRATVAFTDRIEEDAARRDFTVNALYATQNGEVFDPTGAGLVDLEAGRIRFIGTPEDRIREDYLRILRFFRFHAWYANPAGGLDADALAACAALADGIEKLARERIGTEMRKLLAAPDPSPAVAAMAQAGVLQRILPGADPRFLPVLVELEEDVSPDPMRRLAIIGGGIEDHDLRLSRSDAKALREMREGMAGLQGAGELGFRYGAQRALDILLLRAASMEKRVGEAELGALRLGSEAEFPIKAADLMPALSGPALGAELARLEQVWIDSGFRLGKEKLLR